VGFASSSSFLPACGHSAADMPEEHGLRQAQTRVLLRCLAEGLQELEHAMDWDEQRPAPARAVVVGEALGNLSIAELEARIVALTREIERVREELAAKQAHEAAAAAVFKR
jgi:uncharacterized small protein (DUF1192 family)